MSTRPPEGDPGKKVEQLDIPVQAREIVQELCEKVFGDACGHLENIRLAWQVPHSGAGREGEREGWRVYECDVVGMRFAVPHGAPVPMLLADEISAENERVSIVYRYVHPDLIENRDVLLDRLVEYVRDEIRSNLASLSTSFNFMAALREMDALPFGASPSPYHPQSSDEPVGYEPADGERPLDSEAK